MTAKEEWKVWNGSLGIGIGYNNAGSTRLDGNGRSVFLNFLCELEGVKDVTSEYILTEI